jgi:hypothetical protein
VLPSLVELAAAARRARPALRERSPPGSTPARAIGVPSALQIEDTPAVRSKPPPVEPAKLAKAT